jgi:hypothetical protein
MIETPLSLRPDSLSLLSNAEVAEGKESITDPDRVDRDPDKSLEKLSIVLRKFAWIEKSNRKDREEKLLAEKIASIEKLRVSGNERWRALVKHCIFLSIFTLWCSEHVESSAPYWMTKGISSQAFEKGFQGVATVQELYQALHGPILETYFGRTTWDGVSTLHPQSDPSQGNFSYGNGGFVCGFNKIVGSVRISQLRSRGHDCEMPNHFEHDFGDDFRWPCYFDESASFSTNTESKDAFGSFRNGQFLYDGIDQLGNPLSADPKHERAKPWSNYKSLKLHRLYPAPAFAILIDPMRGYEEAKAALQALDRSGYVDLQTKAVFIDATLYNVETHAFIFARLVAEVTDAGLIVTTKDFFFVDCLPFKDSKSVFFFCLMIICSIYYSHFAYEEVVELGRIPTERVKFIMGEKRAKLVNGQYMVTVFDHDITPDTDCSIYEVLVRAGNTIEDGEPLCIIKFRGSKHTMYSCCAGHVRAVNVQRGQKCRNGLTVLDLAASRPTTQEMLCAHSLSMPEVTWRTLLLRRLYLHYSW